MGLEEDERVGPFKRGVVIRRRQTGREAQGVHETKTFPLNKAVCFPVISAEGKYWLLGVGASLCG